MKISIWMETVPGPVAMAREFPGPVAVAREVPYPQ